MRFLFVALALAFATRSGIHVEDMDQTCKPCTDFWRYVNGGWIDKNPIPAKLTSWGPMPVLVEANNERMRTILESANGTRMGTLYESCMDTAAADKRGMTPLQPDFDAIDKVQSVAELGNLLAHLQMLAPSTLSAGNSPVAGPFKLAARADSKNPTRLIAAVIERDGTNGGSSILSLPDREYYTKDDARSKEIRAEFLKHVSKMMPGVDAGRILAFETSLAKGAMDVADRRDPDKTYHVMSVAEATALTPHFDWKLMLRTAGVPETTPINVTEPELLKQVEVMLTTVPLDDWKLWLRWRVLTISAQLLSTEIAAEDFRFNRTVLNGVNEQQPRSQRCATVVDRDMGDALGEAYMKKHFPAQPKQRMSDLVENLRAAMRIDLQKADFMQPETRQYAIKKLDALTVKIGSTDHWRDYSNLAMSPGTYFENERAAWLHNRRYQLDKIGKPIDRSEFRMTPPTVNAYSNSLLVEIVFPAGILQAPLFDMEADDAANYGAIGAVIGHEMGHQFDDSGSKYDATGTLKNWWTPQDREKFEARAACVVNQFDTLDVGGGRHHNGKLVLGEAMGDLGGLSVAYHAYQISLKGKPAPVLDGFTGEQRFFIAFARVWGSQGRPESERVTLATNPHPLPKYRAIATLRNMPEFQRAFQCKDGDEMVRPAADRCKLW